jgi:hypothetical protein
MGFAAYGLPEITVICEVSEVLRRASEADVPSIVSHARSDDDGLPRQSRARLMNGKKSRRAVRAVDDRGGTAART